MGQVRFSVAREYRCGPAKPPDGHAQHGHAVEGGGLTIQSESGHAPGGVIQIHDYLEPSQARILHVVLVHVPHCVGVSALIPEPFSPP